jgi:hypothetical protein
MISENILLAKDQQNDRKFYPRREFKVHIHEKHERRRKYTMRGSESRLISRLDGFNGSLLHQRHHHHEETPRKSSDEHLDGRKAKTYIRNQKSRL